MLFYYYRDLRYLENKTTLVEDFRPASDTKQSWQKKITPLPRSTRMSTLTLQKQSYFGSLKDEGCSTDSKVCNHPAVTTSQN